VNLSRDKVVDIMREYYWKSRVTLFYKGWVLKKYDVLLDVLISVIDNSLGYSFGQHLFPYGFIIKNQSVLLCYFRFLK
jgi:hypothetical protein